MGKEGLFTRTEVRQGKLPTRAAYKQQGLTAEQCHELGERGVRTMNRSVRSPAMQPSGPSRPDLYVLGTAPSEKEDKAGEPFVGAPGMLLRTRIPRQLSVTYDNVCRTHPPKGRDPKWHELECFRPSVVESIEECKPKVVLAAGKFAMNWALPTLGGSVTLAQGRMFPARIGSHECMVYPVQNPSYILRLQGEDRTEEAVEWWERCVDKACTAAGDKWFLPPPVPTEKEVFAGLESFTDEHKILRALKRMQKAKGFALDLETTCKRPYSEGAKILSMSLASAKRTIAFPIDHKLVRFSSSSKNKIKRAVHKLLTTGKVVVAQNLSFDLEWLLWWLGTDIVRGSRWYDTMGEAFMLDERKGGKNLNYLCMQHLGVALKSFVPVNSKALESEPLKKLLRYNALDSKYTFKLHLRLWKLLKQQRLIAAFKQHQQPRVAALTLAQRAGVPVDARVVAELDEEYTGELAKIERAIGKLPEVQQYEKRYGPFNPGSGPACLKVFGSILQNETVLSKKSTKEAVLSQIADEEPLAKLLLSRREAAKVKGTYIDRFVPGARKSHVYPDGKLHTSFNSTIAETGRTTSSDPNMQNIPKRKRGKRVRKMIVPPKGCVFLAADYGQIEARVLAMISKDKAFCEALWKDYDVHMHWAERLREAWPKTYRERGSDIKAFRSQVKNQWVFPQFFGASWRSCAANLQLPSGVAEDEQREFWRMFKGVKRWQEKLISFYNKNHYVECLTGRRRRAPMSYNQAINAPIQGTASDIVVNAMCRMSDLALETDRPWLQPVLNIHDDLTFAIPKKQVDTSVEIIAKQMCEVPFDWVNVPISIEVEVGPNWCDMEVLGVFRSDQ